MQVVTKIDKMQRICARLKRTGRTIGFVPTMGALHEGHASLVRAARTGNDTAVVSIFVNPLQFGPREDLKKYPRPFAKDARLCRKLGVDFVFHPAPEEMYPQGFGTSVEVAGLSDILEGAVRPGHFRGVATVVAKLFNIVQPDTAYFGQKDAQQAVIIRRMVADMALPVKIKVMPTIREKDGLALSSRNVYLSRRQRQDSLVLSKALGLAQEMVSGGQRNAERVIEKMRALIARKQGVKIDYVAIVDADELAPVARVRDNSLIAVAVRFGRTRLIDNIIVTGLHG
ncbi:MAG: pantoate--beta-alanine ligase [Candidatus Omnitrophica bacterium]|nr:pantoate--beta-alanine ligase [Candidatus Omnitrophota bacterium]